MNHTLDQFSDNPIIDELVSWPPRTQAVSTLRGSSPLFRKPFIEVTFTDGETVTRSFAKDGFVGYWAEATVILEALTSIRFISDLKAPALESTETLIAEVLSEREESLEGANLMFENAMYQQYLWQFGSDYKGLSEQVLQNIATAKAHLKGK